MTLSSYHHFAWEKSPKQFFWSPSCLIIQNCMLPKSSPVRSVSRQNHHHPSFRITTIKILTLSKATTSMPPQRLMCFVCRQYIPSFWSRFWAKALFAVRAIIIFLLNQSRAALSLHWVQNLFRLKPSKNYCFLQSFHLVGASGSRQMWKCQGCSEDTHGMSPESESG